MLSDSIDLLALFGVYAGIIFLDGGNKCDSRFFFLDRETRIHLDRGTYLRKPPG